MSILHSESTLIGGVLASQGEFISQILTFIKSDDFEDPMNARIFAAIENLHHNSAPINLMSVTDHLAGQKEGLGSNARAHLLELNVNGDGCNEKTQMYFTKRIQEDSRKRFLVQSVNGLNDVCLEAEDKSFSDLFGSVEGKMSELRRLAADSSSDSFHTSSSLMVGALNKVKTIMENGNKVDSGISYGISDVDAFSMGMHAADMIIVAGRPGMGKTTFAMGTIIENAIYQRIPSLVFSLEMPADQLFERVLANLSGVPYTRFRSGEFRSGEVEALQEAMVKYDIQNAPLYIIDESNMTPTKMRNLAHDFYRRYGIRLAMVDYIQLMIGDGNTRTEEVSDISRSIKNIAKELKIPIIALSQLNRSVEQRNNKRPVNSDLRESGSLEQDADSIIFLYRDEYYNPNTPDKGITEVIWGKARHHAVGTVKVGFDGRLNRFSNLESSKDSVQSAEAPIEVSLKPAESNGLTQTRSSTEKTAFVDDLDSLDELDEYDAFHVDGSSMDALDLNAL